MSNWRTFLIHQESIGCDYMLGIGGQSLVQKAFTLLGHFCLHRKTLSFFLSLDMNV